MNPKTNTSCKLDSDDHRGKAHPEGVDVPDLILEALVQHDIQYKFLSCNSSTAKMVTYFKEFVPTLHEVRLGSGGDAAALAKQLMPTLLKSLTESLSKRA